MATYNSPTYGLINIPDSFIAGYSVPESVQGDPTYRDANPQFQNDPNLGLINPYQGGNGGWSDNVLWWADYQGITPEQAGAALGETPQSQPIDSWLYPHSTGGFDDWVASNGWMFPLAILGAGAASGAFGGAALGAEAGAGAGAGANAVDAYMASAGLDAGTYGAGTGAAGEYGLNAGAPTVGAGSPSGMAATQSSLGLGSAPTGLATSSVGMGGTTGAGSLAGITASEAAAGLGGANLGYGLTASQLAQYEAANPSFNPLDTLNNANKVRNLTNLLKQGAGSGLTSSLGQLAQGANPQGMALPNLVRGNQNPFAYTPQQPIRNATTTDTAQLANLLKQG